MDRRSALQPPAHGGNSALALRQACQRLGRGCLFPLAPRAQWVTRGTNLQSLGEAGPEMLPEAHLSSPAL